MTYDHDDPRLTAYALGELDASQFADVQKILDASEEARKYVDEIRLTAEWLARELQKEAGAPPILSLANHRAIDQTLQQKTSEPRKRRWWKNPRALSVVASILVLCCASAVTFTVGFTEGRLGRKSRRQTAQSEAVFREVVERRQQRPSGLPGPTPDRAGATARPRIAR